MANTPSFNHPPPNGFSKNPLPTTSSSSGSGRFRGSPPSSIHHRMDSLKTLKSDHQFRYVNGDLGEFLWDFANRYFVQRFYGYFVGLWLFRRPSPPPKSQRKFDWFIWKIMILKVFKKSRRTPVGTEKESSPTPKNVSPRGRADLRSPSAQRSNSDECPNED